MFLYTFNSERICPFSDFGKYNLKTTKPKVHEKI